MMHDDRHGLLACVLALALGGLGVAPVYAHQPDEPLPPLDFVPPEPGTYELQRIMRAPDGQVLASICNTEHLLRA